MPSWVADRHWMCPVQMAKIDKFTKSQLSTLKKRVKGLREQVKDVKEGEGNTKLTQVCSIPFADPLRQHVLIGRQALFRSVQLSWNATAVCLINCPDCIKCWVSWCGWLCFALNMLPEFTQGR